MTFPTTIIHFTRIFHNGLDYWIKYRKFSIILSRLSLTDPSHSFHWNVLSWIVYIHIDVLITFNFHFQSTNEAGGVNIDFGCSFFLSWDRQCGINLQIFLYFCDESFLPQTTLVEVSAESTLTMIVIIDVQRRLLMVCKHKRRNMLLHKGRLHNFLQSPEYLSESFAES